MSKTLNLLAKVFTPERNEKLVNCLKQSYEYNADFFEPEIGHDGMVFGLMVYKSNTHFLTELSDTEDWLKIQSRNPKFLMEVDRYKLATYKVGDTKDIDPRFSFPNNRVGAYQLTKANLNQRSLFEVIGEAEDISSDIYCTNLILAHAGNSEEGLLLVYLGIPSKFDENKQIVEWSTIFPIWSVDEDIASLSDITKSEENKVPTEKVAPPTLKLKTA